MKRAPTQHDGKGRLDAKRTGETAEAEFLAKASGLGLSVAKPWGDSDKYDFIVDTGKRTFRVQIKATRSLLPGGGGYAIRAQHSDRRNYTTKDIDTLVAYIMPLDLWYVVPAENLPESGALRFYPVGEHRCQFEQFREAWGHFGEISLPPKGEGEEPIMASPEAEVDSESLVERRMGQWAQRMHSLYFNKKR